MPSYFFEVKESNFKKREKYWNNKYLIDLVNIMVEKENRVKFHNRVNDLFDCDTFECIEDWEKNYKTYYSNNDLIIFNEIIYCFKSWFINLKEGERRNIKGAYCEALAYELFKIKFPDKNIDRECLICSNFYKSSHTVDVAVACNSQVFIACECKYSHKAFSEKDLSNLLNIDKKFKHSNIYVVSCMDSKYVFVGIKNKFKNDKNINKKLKKIKFLNVVDL